MKAADSVRPETVLAKFVLRASFFGIISASPLLGRAPLAFWSAETGPGLPRVVQALNSLLASVLMP